MQRTLQLHRVTIGQTRAVRGPDALETVAVGAVIVIAMLFAVHVGIRQMHVVETLEAVSLAATVKSNETVYLATHGHWPMPDDPVMTANVHQGKYVTDIQIGQNGNMTIHLRLSPTTAHAQEPDTGVLLFRPHLLGVPGYQSVTLLCGYAQPVGPSHVPARPNPTTLGRQDLPPFCR